MVDYLNKHLVNEEDNQEGFFNNLLDRVKKGVSGEWNFPLIIP